MSRRLLNIVFIFSVLLILNVPLIYGQCLYDYPDVHVFPTSNPQSEVHISVNPTNSNNLILSCNSYPGYYSQGYFYSADGGNTWNGAENLHGYTTLEGDPSTAFDANNHAYISTLIYGPNYPLGIYMQSSNNGGTNWTNISDPTDNPGTDKDMIACDNNSTSPFHNNLYCGWTDENSYQDLTSSNNGGGSFGPIIISHSYGRGVNIQAAPNGHVFAVWADYGSNNTPPSKGLIFSISTNGGQSFSSPTTAFSYSGIDVDAAGPDPIFNNIRVNDFPSIAVDKSNGINSGRIYVVYPEEVNNAAVIGFRYSDNEGTTWSAPIILSSPNFRESFFPWISVDPTNGDIYVVYYAFDQTTGFSTDVYVAYSNNGGTSFQNIRVSDVPFITQPITGVPNLAPGYMGDYIGIAAYGGKAWAAWMDNRNGTWQIYTSKVAPAIINGPSEICSSATYSIPNLPAGVTVSWSASPSNIVSLSPNGNQVTVTKITHGTITLTASMSNSCQVQKNIQIPGAPSITQINIDRGGPTCVGTNYQQMYFGVIYNDDSGCNLSNDGIADVDWQIYSPQPYQSTYDYLGTFSCSAIHAGIALGFAIPNNPFEITLRVRVKNECGEWSSWSPGYSFQINSCSYSSYSFSISPNPASETITITPDVRSKKYSKVGEVDKNELIKEVKIYTSSGKLVMQRQFSSNSSVVQMDISSLTPGIYLVEVSNGQHTETHKLVIGGNPTLTK